MSYTENNPLNKSASIEEVKTDTDLNLFLAEVGIFNNEDTNTPFDTYFALVATEVESDVSLAAIHICENSIGLNDDEFFRVINDIEKVNITDFE